MILIDEILNLIFPNVCGFCGKINKDFLCEDCEEKIDFMINQKIRFKLDKNFEKYLCIFPYEGEIREKILDYKFKDKSYIYKTFSKIILKSKKICFLLEKYDIITAVPIHKKRKAQRGYNQSELIAREIGKRINNLEYRKTLKKDKNNVRQSSLNHNERKENVKNAYQIINKEIISNKKIVLFDDIYTTGSTVNECSRVLKENGAKEILILTLAKK